MSIYVFPRGAWEQEHFCPLTSDGRTQGSPLQLCLLSPDMRNSNKYLYLSILSLILLGVFVFVDDWRPWLDKLAARQQLVDLGLAQNCQPSQAVCAVSFKVEARNQVRIALAMTEKQPRQFYAQLKIRSDQALDIDKISMQYLLPGRDTPPAQRLILAKTDNHKNNYQSEWEGIFPLPQADKSRHDWIVQLQIRLRDKIIQTRYYLYK